MKGFRRAISTLIGVGVIVLLITAGHLIHIWILSNLFHLGCHT